MKVSIVRSALNISVAAALLSGCGGTQPPVASPGKFNAPKTPRGPKQSQTFSYTGSEQTFTVPAGVTRVTIKASGASGQGEYSSGAGALGGMIVATVRVTPGESLAVFVGSEYIQWSTGSNRRGLGGYNGGGNAGEGSSSYSGAGGGGASDVRQGGDGLQNRIVVAGGGGGGGYYGGGSGGGKKGRNGSPATQQGLNASGGTGGARHNGGTGGKGGVGHYGSCAGGDGANGSLGNGARGGAGVVAGGGGGGGYYGGGGGGGGGFCYEYSGWYGGFGGGGGGGSSYAEPEAIRVVDKRGGAAPGNGQVIISWR
jgi:hypothetical protein